MDPARIIIYKDRIEATNPCYPKHKGLLTPKNSIPFQKNPLISKFFMQLGWVEEIGSGLINVTEYLPKYHHGAHVEFLEDDIFRVIIRLPRATDDAPGVAEMSGMGRGNHAEDLVLGLLDHTAWQIFKRRGGHPFSDIVRDRVATHRPISQERAARCI